LIRGTREENASKKSKASVLIQSEPKNALVAKTDFWFKDPGAFSREAARHCDQSRKTE
jgi:hypothetical protein